MITTAQSFAKTLKQAGVKRVYGYPGGEVIHLLEALRQEEINFVLTKHETPAAFMAGVEGELTGIPGVCLTTLGPGATNMVTGVANAFLDKSPLLAISGQVGTDLTFVKCQQNLDLNGVFKPITKWQGVIGDSPTQHVVEKGIKIATKEPAGPVFIEFPSNRGGYDDSFSEGNSKISAERIRWDAVNQQVLGSVKTVIEQAERPVIFAGLGGVKQEAGTQITELAQKLYCPVITTGKGKGLIDERHVLSAGVVGMAGEELVNDLFRKADVVVAIGVDPVEVYQPWDYSASVISIDYKEDEDCYIPSQLSMIGHLPSLLGCLLEQVEGENKWPEEELRSHRLELERHITPQTKGLGSHEVIQTVQTLLPQDSIVTCDVGAHHMLVGQLWKCSKPKTLLMSNGLFTMGYGLPAAMAAKIVCPDQPVVCFVGDGGFSMYGTELETATRLNLPLITVVFVDSRLNLIRIAQGQQDFPPYGVHFNNPDFKQFAESFGAKGYQVNNKQQFSQVFTQALQDNSTTVIGVEVDPDGYALKY